jgi:hypothetical protein
MHIYRTSFNPEYLAKYQDNMGKKTNILELRNFQWFTIYQHGMILTMNVNPFML